MKFFIPAWYQEDNWWRDSTIPFYDKKNRSDFDDMISLMNMHRKNNQPFKLIQLGYHSGFQLFLHRNHLYECDYYSVFDDIQGFPKSTPRPLDYRAFNWPDGTEFIYTLFIIKAIYGNTTTNIYYNEDGYLVWMEKFVDNRKVARYVFDNRGFLSTIMTYKDGKEHRLLYLDLEQDVIMEESLLTGEVTILKSFERFESKHYANMEVLIKERLAHYLQNQTMHRMIAAFDERHNNLIASVVPNALLTYSVFKARNTIQTMDGLKDKRFIVDTKKNESALLSTVHPSNVLRITPFDTEHLPSISSQLYVDYIGIFIDGVSDEVVIECIEVLQPLLLDNGKYKLVLLTRFGQHTKSERLKHIVQDVNEQFLEKEDIEDLLEDAIKDLEVIKFENIPFEVDLMKVIAKLRVIVDFNEEPDLYIQIASISSGIPQINKVESDYVQPEMNGLVVQQVTALLSAVQYYLLSLKHWNNALSYSYKLIDQYSSINIIETIDRFLEGGSYGEKV